MADRYWVGGTANWDGTAGTKWATTSGGAGGASVPTSADDVFFDAASSGTCTIATGNTGAKSINCTGFTGTIAGTAAITVSGSVTLVAGMTYTHTGTMTFNATGTLTTAGKTFSGVTVSGSGITLTLGDALDVSTRNVIVTQGTFDTANYNVTGGALDSTNSNVRTITLGSSTLTFSSAVNPLSFNISTNLTFNANTSQINLSSSSASLLGGSQTFYNVSFTSTTAGTRAITGANTFNDLSVTGPASAGLVQLTFSAAQTINGTLSTTGTAGNRRVWFRSSIYGGGQTLTVNAASLTDADFRDIYVIGAGAPISGTRIGNRGNNRGITFSTPKSVYWNLGGLVNWLSDAWAPSSAGTPNTDNFPLPQDTAIFDNAGTASTVSLPGTSMYIPSVDMSARTTSMEIGRATTLTTAYGSWTFGTGVSMPINFTGGIEFSGEGTKTITSNGVQFKIGNITVNAYNGSVELADAFDCNSQGGGLVITNGTFDTKNYNVTADGLSSSNSNFRTITLGSSTITLSGNPITFSTSTNLTFNAGTSQITTTRTSAATFAGGGQTFYNVSFTGTTAVTHVVNGANTFNDFTLTAPAAAGLMQCTFGANQTITGTLTCAGATAVRRIFVRSDTLDTTRTLTVGTLSADDCDFRDITIAGTAAGSSPTRAGDCGGNSGINFPAPKTVYWNLAGAQNWSATAWAPGTGGVPDINNFPLAQDTAVFDEAAGSVTGTITIDRDWNIGTFDASARTSAMTLTTGSNAPFVYGNWLFGTGVTSSSTTGTITFAKRGTSTITSNGVTFGCNVTSNCVTGIVQLADALVLDSARTLTLTSGTFDAVTYNVTTGLFTASSGSTLKMGSGTWTISGTGPVWTLASSVFYKGTANILLSDTSTTARTFSGGSNSYNKLTIGGTTGTSTLTISGNNQFTELASTKTVAHTIALGTTTQTFGKWSVTGTSGNVVTLTGTGTSHILAGDATSGIDYLAIGSIRFAATSPGEFYAGANSTATGSPTAPTFLTATPAGRTLYWVGGTGNWNDTARWSLSSGGGGGEAVPRSMDNVIFDSASNATGYTATVNQITGGNRCKALTIAGPATGNLTLAGSVALFIHDDITLPATGLTRTYTGDITLSSSQTGRTLTTNGVALASAITVNGVSCEWTLADALNNGSSPITVTNGLFDTDTYNLTASSLSSNNANSRTVDLGSSTVTLSSLTSINFGTTETNRASFTFTAGTSQINLSSASATIDGNNQTFYNASFASTSTGTRSITGANTFNNLTLTASATGLSQLSISANQTVNGTFTCAGSSATARGFVRSDTIGTTRTITAATLSANDCDFRDITIAGVAAGTSPTRAGDCGGNSGITFPAAKTVYWNLATTPSNWNATAWATTNNGTPAVDNFPLAQDTATFTDSGSAGTVNFSSTAYNFSAIDASTRTSAMTLGHNGSQTLYGSYALGSGVTVSGTSGQTFAGRGTMTFTSAGKTITFPITVDAPGGTFQLGDATTTSNTITHTRGTFDANNYNLTATTFASSNSNVRTITMGSGTWTLSGTSTVWTTSTSTNLTLNANTSTILFSDTSATSRQFSGGDLSFNKLTIGGATGTSITSISGFNSFNELASTKTVAHTVRFITNQNTIGTWSVTGSSGNVVTVDSSAAATRQLMRLTNVIYDTNPIDYLNVQSIQIDAIDKFYAGANSTNVGNTLNVYFAAAPTPPPPVVSGGNMFLLFM